MNPETALSESDAWTFLAYMLALAVAGFLAWAFGDDRVGERH